MILYLNVYLFLFLGVNNSQSLKRQKSTILIHPDTTDIDIEKTNATKLILSLGSAAISFITICIAIAAIVARCQKRGTKTRRRYDESPIEFSKLVE